MPMTRPPASLAPLAAASGSPGQAPVTVMHWAFAIAVPNLWDLARCSTGVLSAALPMTPIFSRMAFAGVLAVDESDGVSEENIAWSP